MPNKNTPEKHKTPNWRLVNRTALTGEWNETTNKPETRMIAVWEAQPLRASRKDLV